MKSEPAPAAVLVPEPLPEPIPVAQEWNPEPTPEPVPVATKPKPTGGLSAFDSMIADAPEVSELPPPPEPPPWKNDKPAVPEVKQPEAPTINPAIEDAFYNDPLIQAALVKFEGKVLA